tara:strand:- start:927 stop:1361 length:435 start_codon:yes stop_codon:yes gene_type:complete
MAVTSIMCTSFKIALLDGEMDFSSDTALSFKVALYTSSSTIGAATTVYTTTDEASGTGYTAGGAAVTIAANPTSSGTTAYLDLDNVTWGSSSITARKALIYSADGVTNPAIAVIDFGADVQSSEGNFVITMPAGDANNAIIRLG